MSMVGRDSCIVTPRAGTPSNFRASPGAGEGLDPAETEGATHGSSRIGSAESFSFSYAGAPLVDDGAAHARFDLELPGAANAVGGPGAATRFARHLGGRVFMDYRGVSNLDHVPAHLRLRSGRDRTPDRVGDLRRGMVRH